MGNAEHNTERDGYAHQRKTYSNLRQVKFNCNQVQFTNLGSFMTCIFVADSAVLFYIVKGKKSEIMGIKLRRHIVTTLLKALETYLDDSTMMRNGCLTLCQLKIPADVVITDIFCFHFHFLFRNVQIDSFSVNFITRLRGFTIFHRNIHFLDILL